MAVRCFRSQDAIQLTNKAFAPSVVAHCQQLRRDEFAALLEQLLAMAPLELPVCECERIEWRVLIDVMLNRHLSRFGQFDTET